jgi:dienelactone hydrolase
MRAVSRRQSLAALPAAVVPLQGQQPSPYYEEQISASNHIRTQQVRELEAYIDLHKEDRRRLADLFNPDYSSTQAFEESTRRLRAAFENSIGWPVPGTIPREAPTYDRIGEDAVGVYYRVRLPVVDGVHSVGIYITPKKKAGRSPLIISMHGGGGSPEIALFNGGGNYHDMVRGAVKRGYAVYAPTHLFKAEGYPPDIRLKIDDRLRAVGTSITAVETAKITRAIDHLTKRPEVDGRRIGMVGLSYGGYYTLVAPALDRRIRVAVSSCYFGVQEYRYERDELAVPTDFRFMDRMSLFRDDVLTALICPRALEIQAGRTDAPTHREKGVQLAPGAAAHYAKLNRSDKFRFLVFEGGHEFHDASAWEWIAKHI